MIPEDQGALTTIGPFGYKVFFADNEDGFGALHTNFMLNSTGETLSLSHRTAGDEAISLDEIAFGPMTQDESYGRSADGVYDWIVFQVPTPDASNSIEVGLVEKPEEGTTQRIIIYPNPSSENLNLSVTGLQLPISVEVFNKNGDLVHRAIESTSRSSLGVSSWASGLYLLKIIDVNGEHRTKRFIVN